MRDPRQEARRIPHALTQQPDGHWYVTLYHESMDVVCPAAPTTADAVREAVQVMNSNFPGRTL